VHRYFLTMPRQSNGLRTSDPSSLNKILRKIDRRADHLENQSAEPVIRRTSGAAFGSFCRPDRWQKGRVADLSGRPAAGIISNQARQKSLR
jgi:hypothetical protein